MKKDKLVILAILPLLFSCGKKDEKPQESHVNDGQEHNLKIVYQYENGEVFDVVEESVMSGSSFNHESPIVPFMKADKAIIKDKIWDKDLEYYVTYSYGGEKVRDIEHETTFARFMVDESKGISFTFSTKNIETRYNTFFRFGKIHFRSGYITYNDGNSEEKWGLGKAVISKKEYSAGLLIDEYQEHLLSISISPNHIVDYYLDGEILYTFPMNIYSNNDSMLLGDAMKNIFSTIKEDSIFTGGEDSHGNPTYTMDYLSLNYALDKTKAKEVAKEYNIVKALYKNDLGAPILERSKVSVGSNSYSFPAANIYGYSFAKIEGKTDVSKTIDAKSSFAGSERLKGNKTIDQTGLTNWPNMEMWLPIAPNLSGDFSVRIKLRHFGSVKKEFTGRKDDHCWRTLLPVVFDPDTNDRWVTRFDPMQWRDDLNGDGRHLGDYEIIKSIEVPNVDRDYYYLFHDCDMEILVNRVGTSVEIHSYLKCNLAPYEGVVYDFAYRLNNCNREKLSIALSAEDAKAEVTSIYYQ